MHDHTPSVYLLAGPDGPAKAAYARKLTEHGFVEVPPGPPADLATAVVEHLRAGHDVFLDHDSPAAMYGRAGLDAKGIVAKVFETLGKDYKTESVKLA